jgi:hypothetical protein
MVAPRRRATFDSYGDRPKTFHNLILPASTKMDFAREHLERAAAR